MDPRRALNVAIILDDWDEFEAHLPWTFEREYKDIKHPLVLAMTHRKTQFVEKILTRRVPWDSALLHEVIQTALNDYCLDMFRIVVPSILIIDDLLNDGFVYRQLFASASERGYEVMRILAQAQMNPSVVAQRCIAKIPEN